MILYEVLSPSSPSSATPTASSSPEMPSQLVISVLASEGISSGTELSMSYLKDVILSTYQERQEILFDNFYFHCDVNQRPN